MPKIQWAKLPRAKWQHLRKRAQEREVSLEDLFALSEWKAQDPDVPEGDWFKDFGLNSQASYFAQPVRLPSRHFDGLPAA